LSSELEPSVPLTDVERRVLTYVGTRGSPDGVAYDDLLGALGGPLLGVEPRDLTEAVEGLERRGYLEDLASPGQSRRWRAVSGLRGRDPRFRDRP